MRFAIKRSILFCLLLLLMCAGSSVYIVTLMNKGNVGHWTINISYYALQSGILIGGALAGVFVAVGFSHPKRPLSVVGTVALALLYFFFASLMLGLILQKVGPYLSCLAEAVLAYLLIRYPGRASLEPIYRRLEEHSQTLKPLAFIGVPLSLFILDFSARGLVARWPEPILAVTVWGILVTLCLGIGSISIAILVPSSRTRRIISRLSYIGGMLALVLLVANPGLFLTERCQDTENRPRFFPKPAKNPGDQLKDYWYAMYLTALRERPLCCNSSGSAEVYRFTWLRTFHHPVVISLEHDLKGRWLMHTKVTSGAGGYEPGILAEVHKADARGRPNRVESSHVRSFPQRGKRGNHTIYFLGTAACDCTCESRGEARIREAMRPLSPRRQFPRLSHRINVLTQSCSPAWPGVA
jgi:hypothetical protein